MDNRLAPQLASSAQEVLAGLVERVTFHNADNGFCVVRVKARGHRDLVTVVGHAAAISAGEWITAGGEWVNDRSHGQQFKSRFLRTSAPTTTEGIEKYLGSGMIRGIGPVYARKMIKAFGDRVFESSRPSRIACVRWRASAPGVPRASPMQPSMRKTSRRSARSGWPNCQSRSTLVAVRRLVRPSI
jgi:ATP-dependent exoDNAse (exonuclease V) alpha subunit